MKVAIYCRISTDDKEQNPERQLIKCRQYCELHDHEIIGEYIDKHTGDSNLNSRPQGKIMLEQKPEGIVFYSMDRLTRQHPSKMMILLQYLKDSGMIPISATEPAFNLESDFSEVILYIMGYFNNYYLKELKKNVKSGLERARAQGKQLGRPKNKVNLHEIARAFKEKDASISTVSKKLGIPRSTIYRHYEKCVQKGYLQKS